MEVRNCVRQGDDGYGWCGPGRTTVPFSKNQKLLGKVYVGVCKDQSPLVKEDQS